MNVLSRRETLEGYELYLVEQWACSRDYLTPLIATFTGLPQHRIIVGVVSVPAVEAEWSVKLQAYVQNISETYARKKETPLGTVMVTSLGAFPSALSVIAVPDGRFYDHETEFTVNENLKRMGCSGRAGLSFALPNTATQNKFRQLYRISDRIPVITAVIELVRLCQVALVLFKQIPREYTDGFLCDVTIEALRKWWAEIGTDYFNLEPNDGALGPSTVSALLGTLLGARNRLNYCNAPVTKDVFDIRATKRGVEHFQKWNKLEKTRRIDRDTLEKLHRSTSKAVKNDGWAVPRAVKSTVAELGGKGGEMVMDMVGTRERNNIAAVETMNIQDFVHTLSGEHCRWLWHGKPKKSTTITLPSLFTSDEESISSGEEDDGPSSRKARESSTGDGGLPFQSSLLGEIPDDNPSGSQLSLVASDKDQQLRRTVLKTVAGRMNDAKAGFGRFKDVVGMTGLRGQPTKWSKDQDAVQSRESLVSYGVERNQAAVLDDGIKPEDGHKETETHGLSDRGSASTGPDARKSIEGLGATPFSSHTRPDVTSASGSGQAVGEGAHLHDWTRGHTNPLSRDYGVSPDTISQIGPYSHDTVFYKTQSFDCLLSYQPTEPDLQSRRNRRSLSTVNLGDRFDAVFDLEHCSSEIQNLDTSRATSYQKAEAWNHEATAARLAQELDSLNTTYQIYSEENAKTIDRLDHQIQCDQEQINNDYIESYMDINRKDQAAADRVAAEKVSFGEVMSRIEGHAAKLDYELSGLESKVEDVEDGVNDYADQVSSLEERTRALDLEDYVEDSLYRRVLRFMIGAE